MILYIDKIEVPDVEAIPPAVLRYCVEEAERAQGRYHRLEAYYRGEHPIFQQKPDSPEDVRLAANYAKYVVDTVLGYYLGDPVKYDANEARTGHAVSAAQTEGAESVKPETEIDLSPLLDCYDAQQISRVDVEIGRTMGIEGDCLELCYASSEDVPRPRSARIRPANGILVCDSTVEHNKLFGIVWEKRRKITRQEYYFVTVYTDQSEQDFVSTDLKTAVFQPVGERRAHYFGAVPMIAYENNAERQGDFEQITSLIDAYDRLLSDRVTDKRKFVDALLVFYGMQIHDGNEENLVKHKFLDSAPLDARAEYVQKTFDEAGVQVLADALVREMHKQTMTVDMSDESFAGNASGQALKLKLLTMNLMVKNKMRQVERGLKERFSLYNAWLTRAGRMAPVGVNDVDIVFGLALPINEQEIVQTVTSLQGIVDDQTLLSQLWFIRDPAEALENIKRQKQENQREYQATFGAANAEPGQDGSEDEKAAVSSTDSRKTPDSRA